MMQRNVIKFGKNSYVISLPKHWVDNNKLEKGSQVFLEENNNTLQISSQYKDNTEPRIKVIYLDDLKCSIKRTITAAYVNDYSEIRIVGRNVSSVMKDVRDTMADLMAFEIMEQTDQKIVLKDFLNVKDIDFNHIIKRIDIIVRSMFLDCITRLKNGEPVDLKERDRDVNRLYVLASKILNKLLYNPSLSKVIGAELTDTLHMWRFINGLERGADQLKRIVKLVDAKKNKSKHTDEIVGLLERIYDMYLEAIKAYYKKDFVLADSVIEKKLPLFQDCDKVIQVLDFNENSEYNVGYIFEKMKNLVSAISDVAYATINIK